MMILLQATEAVAVAAEQAPKTMGLGELFLAGGFLMWPLLILGGVAVFIFFERFWAIRKASAVDMNFMNRIREHICEGRIGAAVQLCRQTNTPIAHMIEKGIGRIGRPLSDVQSSIENVANLEVSKLETGLPILATIAGGAPFGSAGPKSTDFFKNFRDGCPPSVPAASASEIRSRKRLIEIGIENSANEPTDDRTGRPPPAALRADSAKTVPSQSGPLRRQGFIASGNYR